MADVRRIYVEKKDAFGSQSEGAAGGFEKLSGDDRHR